ncbi:subtilisin-like protease SBT5.6 [Sesamum indicum]|uniref:Subtilisin-like protease SBT5.6 n=2 Tax=Sesamum indicum TaxID=4182 RepID=A0A6I9UJW1_SESIN|nr:subtilisin-like protease SBT5.6 [Sesamum indicum]
MNNQYYVVLIVSLLILLVNVSTSSAQRQVYIVYLGEHRHSHSGKQTWEEIEEMHHSYLQAVKGSKEEAKACIIYSYKNVINGFSALLTPQEAATISEMEGVISVFHSHPTKSRLHTTRSWHGMSLLEANWDATRQPINPGRFLRRAGYGKNVIVGVLDSGVWPESQSFNDEGMEPIPSSWKGICESGVAFNSSHCNRKLVGARYYLKSYEANFGPLDPKLDFRSPRDINGHGTHTSSTIGGRRVRNAAAIGGFGYGTATGGAPLVRLAIYKVCWPIPGQTPAEGNTCLDDDMLAAFDDAIADGVQVISVSIGRNTSTPYIQDGIAIGSLHAVKRNIVVACSAGNSGPTPFTVTNVAPWIITVGASSIDRVFSSPVLLGNGAQVQGQSITPFKKGTYPLVYAADVEIPGTTTTLTNGLCLNGTLSPRLVRGKAVFCWRGDTFQALEVQRAGGVATVLGNVFDGIGVIGRPYLIPGTVVPSNQTLGIYNYIATHLNPTATLTPAKTLIGTKPAPFMAAFTSRGPNFIEPNILKPDITAPGLNILAAWSEASSPLNVPSDRRVVKFQIDSGTSMACPHVAAVAALLKAIHPDWSSAAIRSALMTTAKLSNNVGKPITDSLGNTATPFQYGAGHIQPSKAADPGLVYDASYTDYLLFLCSSSSNLLDPSFTCPQVLPSPSNFNYPSLAISNLRSVLTVRRSVTNVGMGNSTYSVTINPPPGYSVRISPATLYFGAAGEKQNFSITVRAGRAARRNVFAFGWYSWSDGIHLVRSPISVSKA